MITRWAAKRTHSATEFYAAGRGVSGRANGVATAGDYLSASTFLGYAGLMYLYGFDGWIIGLGACLSFLPVLYLLAERMRNAGKFTVADVLAFRLKARPVRIATAINTLLISGIYLVAQLVGAGAVIEALAGHQLPGRRADLRRLHGRLRRLRRHAGHDVGADHQGRDADDRGHRRRGRGAGEVQLQPGRSCSTRRPRTTPTATRSSARART